MFRFARGRVIEKVYYSKLGRVFVPMYELLQRDQGARRVTVFDSINIEINPSKTGERAIPFYAFEPRVTKEVIRLLKPNDTVLDVGAWIGYYSLIAAKMVGSKGRVIAVEPLSDNLARLATNISLNGFENIEIVAAAVGEQPGTGYLGRGVSSSTFRLSAKDQTEEVKLTTIDCIVDQHGLDSVELMIIDVEGYENLALKGASRCLSRGDVRNIICEVHPLYLKSYGLSEEDIMTFFEETGFKVRLLDERAGDRPFHLVAQSS